MARAFLTTQKGLLVNGEAQPKKNVRHLEHALQTLFHFLSLHSLVVVVGLRSSCTLIVLPIRIRIRLSFSPPPIPIPILYHLPNQHQPPPPPRNPIITNPPSIFLEYKISMSAKSTFSIPSLHLFTSSLVVFLLPPRKKTHSAPLFPTTLSVSPT